MPTVAVIGSDPFLRDYRAQIAKLEADPNATQSFKDGLEHLFQAVVDQTLRSAAPPAQSQTQLTSDDPVKTVSQPLSEQNKTDVPRDSGASQSLSGGSSLAGNALSVALPEESSSRVTTNIPATSDFAQLRHNLDAASAIADAPSGAFAHAPDYIIRYQQDYDKDAAYFAIDPRIAEEETGEESQGRDDDVTTNPSLTRITDSGATAANEDVGRNQVDVVNFMHNNAIPVTDGNYQSAKSLLEDPGINIFASNQANAVQIKLDNGNVYKAENDYNGVDPNYANYLAQYGNTWS